MHIERIGYLGNKLYRFGWHSAVHRNLTPVQHFLFSIFLYYRRGFASGCNWVKECRTEKTFY